MPPASKQVVRKGGAGRVGTNPGVFHRARAAPPKLQLEAFFTASHRPPVIGREKRFQKKRKRLQDGLVRAQLPIIDDAYTGPVLFERPNAAAFEIAFRDKSEAIRIA